MSSIIYNTLRLSPSTRTRLTNTFFILSCSLSILTVSLGMSGGVGKELGLPCPARKSGDKGLGLEGEEDEVRFERRLRKSNKSNAGRETDSLVAVGSTTTRKSWMESSSNNKRTWLEDPKPKQSNSSQPRKSWISSNSTNLTSTNTILNSSSIAPDNIVSGNRKTELQKVEDELEPIRLV